MPQTKEERAAKKKIYYEKNKDTIAAKHKEWIERNKDNITAYNKKRYEENKDKINASSKEWKEKNKDKLVAYEKKRYEENKVILKQKAKDYREQNKEEIAQKMKKYRKTEAGIKSGKISGWKGKGMVAIDDNWDIVYETYINTTCCNFCSNEFKNSLDKHLDHDHETGEIRGVLCRSCNRKDVFSDGNCFYRFFKDVHAT